MVTKLAEEIKELRTDRKIQLENQDKLQKFITHALAREIKEFAQDRQAVVEQRVKLVAEGRAKLEELKEKLSPRVLRELVLQLQHILKVNYHNLKKILKSLGRITSVVRYLKHSQVNSAQLI